MAKSPLTYDSYLQLETLLSLQKIRSDPPEHDETLFIIVHQVYELWFKLLLHELEAAREALGEGELYTAIPAFKRARTVMKTMVAQIDVIETMTPMSFGSFRDRLESASGFQSMQFREMEFLLGYKRPNMLAHHRGHPANLKGLERRLAEPSVVDGFYRFLVHRGMAVPETLLKRDVHEANQPNEELQAQLIRMYREQPDAAVLLELITDFDEGLQEWRYRHVKMVERTIGNKRGTGGSPGVEFLRQSLFLPMFHDLWAIRHAL